MNDAPLEPMPGPSPLTRALLDRLAQAAPVRSRQPDYETEPGLYIDRGLWKKLLVTAAERTTTRRFGRYFLATQAIFAGLRGAVIGARALDDVLFPGWRDQPIEEPVFIFANARSGTTLLHRLMSLDEERFTYSRLYETLFHAVCVHRVIDAVAAADQTIGGGVLRRVVDEIDDRVFGFWRDIHPMGLYQAEEDEGYFLYSLYTPGLYPLWPYVRGFEAASWLDDQPPAVRERVMTDFEGAIRRLLYVQGRGRTLLSKSVFMPGRIHSFIDHFPDARFVYPVRHPYEAVASFVSMITAVWTQHSPEVPHDNLDAQALGDIAVRFYRHGWDARKRVAPSQWRTVRYTDLVADPRRTVLDIYAHFGMKPSPGYLARLDAETAKARQYRSKHRYTLADFGLDKERIVEPLRDVFDELGFAP
jgi:hypothetical protein